MKWFPILITAAFCLFFCCVSFAQDCVDTVKWTPEKKEIARAHVEAVNTKIENALFSRLQTTSNPEKKQALQRDKQLLNTYYTSFINDKTFCSELRYNYNSIQIANRANIMVEIQFKTDKTGATVKYRAVGVSDKTCNDSTNNCTALLAVGTWEFWSERKGKPTSDVYRQSFTNDQSFRIEEK